MKKTAGVIVTFNRKELLLENIKMLQKQTKKLNMIYIIDNHGTDGTEKFLKDKKVYPLENVKYIYLPENIGGAGGFEYGTKKAFEDGYDYIILMDDDGKPQNEKCIEKLIDYANNQKESKLMINSLVTFSKDEMSFGIKGEYKVSRVIENAVEGAIINEINPFNGTLISKELIKKIGYPNGSLFIKGDEEDYTIRAKKVGAIVNTVIDSVYHHPILKENEKKFLCFNVKYKIESPWKEYYRVRNRTYIYMREKKYLKVIRLFLSRLKDTLLADCKKMKTIKMIFKGLFDGLTKKLGKRVLPS